MAKNMAKSNWLDSCIILFKYVYYYFVVFQYENLNSVLINRFFHHISSFNSFTAQRTLSCWSSGRRVWPGRLPIPCSGQRNKVVFLFK
jgi:hypothetical protein